MDRKVLSRRKFLKATSGILAAAAVSPAWARQHNTSEYERSLAFVNLHTGEKLHSTYWVEGEYQQDELHTINHLLRDHRNGDQIQIDHSLLDLLHDIRAVTGTSQPLHVISAYRSPETNAKLSKNSNGVAKKSLHMQGKAIDIRLPDVSLDKLHKRALSLRAGGVGYYRRSDFIHLDVGRVRNWRG
ncbi:MAG: DUF882 domain-containing protein [Motiliproteus sp.]|nr:DUF882 domain-containing protein [Motiliproteus sp.]MCW9053616.1 DUF882 domain-containing protein [Motiliproteus sp.]